MNKVIAIILIVFGLVAGYLIGSFFPVKGFFSANEQGISGNAILKVTVLRPDKKPATNLEVDIATEVGKVLNGGHVNTDSNGVATFKIKPGTYYIFFNANNFPKNLLYKDVPPVLVTESSTAAETIILQEGKQ